MYLFFAYFRQNRPKLFLLKIFNYAFRCPRKTLKAIEDSRRFWRIRFRICLHFFMEHMGTLGVTYKFMIWFSKMYFLLIFKIFRATPGTYSTETKGASHFLFVLRSWTIINCSRFITQLKFERWGPRCVFGQQGQNPNTERNIV